ncbi:uncharacterized protein LOC133822501 [Humulus lupulus]|uniref:uncharacterized protein LOC133822501 n=1 Tax=Humulus lupulus TaxID=3486 RepID=UPI002B404676|nr:uncharacterized protein LOC133822501 [Humulus lupulus]
MRKKMKKSQEEEENCGVIFMCNGSTKPQCYLYRVFGLPMAQQQVVLQIKPGAKLFLYDFGVKLLYGVYEATSVGALNLEPTAFHGKFPAQVKFKIFKECLPLPEWVFKAAIRDNYQGSRFNQLLSSAQVNALISLFRPLHSTPPTYNGPLLSNVATPQERFHQQTTILPRLPGVAVHHVPPSQMPADTRLKQVVAPPPHAQYVPLTTVQPPMQQHRHVVEPPALPHNAALYHEASGQVSYLPEKSSSDLQDPYLRYNRELEMVHRHSVVEYASDYGIPQLPKQGENENIPRSNYVAEYGGQHLPTTTSHITLHSHSLPQSYAPMTPSLPAHPQVELPVFHEPYYPTSTHGNPSQVYNDPLQRLLPGSSEANVAAPSHVSFVGAAPTYL